MDELSKVLKVLLKRMPYELFLKNRLDCMDMEGDLLNHAVHSYMPAHSDTEIRYMLESIGDFLNDYAAFLDSESAGRRKVSVFDAVFRFADVALIRRNNEVMCRYDHILRWRMTTIDISEEIFVAAFTARKDLQKGIQCKDFTWPTVIGHNNMQLRNLTNRGMAENHFHLWGSSPYFHLTWIWMMNHPEAVECGPESDMIERNMRSRYMVYDKRYPEKDMKSCCLQAALVRLFLYTVLTDTKAELRKYYVNWECLKPWIHKFDECIEREKFEKLAEKYGCCRSAEILEAICRSVFAKKGEKWKEFIMYIPSLRILLDKKTDIRRLKCSGDKVSLQEIMYFVFREQGKLRLKECRRLLEPKEYDRLWNHAAYQALLYYLDDQEAFVRHLDWIQNEIDNVPEEKDDWTADYALDAIRSVEYQQSQINFVLSGERYLMYEMFRRIDSRDRSLPPHIYNLFYAYLIMKEKVRSELVQSNEWVGFENFSVYQERKDYYAAEPAFDVLKARMAVLSCMEQNVKLLELRVSPGSTAHGNFEKISYLDTAIDPEKKMREKFFYVMHFIKRPDDEIQDMGYCKCRHSVLRNDCEKKALALMEFRRNFPCQAKRVLGIDAASQEIGCRPEVFGQAFRTLQNDTCITYTGGEYMKLPQLRVTYHVGEDFLDVADGLRAIDEAVLFLNLDCGDRLGHALALGISVSEWYDFKQHRISLPKQDYLDNLVWLYHAIIRYHIPNQDNLKNYIETEFRKYFDEIYAGIMTQEYLKALESADGKRNHKNSLVFDIYVYYDAWKLRGDAPELYQNGYFKRDSSYMSSFEVNAVNFKYPSDLRIREKAEVAILYYLYHYDAEVRQKGRKKVDIKVTDDYIKGVALVQKAMQTEIAMRGIAIETNPSSNYMIGTFKRYENHPIIQFYNNGLTFDQEKLASSPQIWVSINTDDQGVFDIKLENEYALLARALEKQKDEEGNLIYQKSMIYEWLDKIREMGLSQSFFSAEP